MACMRLAEGEKGSFQQGVCINNPDVGSFTIIKQMVSELCERQIKLIETHSLSDKN